MSFQDLPNELIRNIFSYVDRCKVYRLSLLCTQFREAVHGLAVRRIRILLKRNSISPECLKRLGWTEEDHLPTHEESQCPCVDIIFRYKPFGYSTKTSEKEEIVVHAYSQDRDSCSSNVRAEQTPCEFTVIEDNIVTWNTQREDTLTVYSRCKSGICKEENKIVPSPFISEKRLTIDECKEAVHLYSNKNLLVILTKNMPESRPDLFEVKIVDLKSTANDQDLNFYKEIPEIPEVRKKYIVSDIALTRDTLAIRLFTWTSSSKDYTLFYKICKESSSTQVSFQHHQSTPTKVQIGSGEYRSSGFICVNDRYFVVHYLKNEMSRYLDTALMIHDRNRMVNSQNYIPDLMEYKFTFPVDRGAIYKEDSLYIEPGCSPYLISFEPYTPSIYLIHLENRQPLVHIKLMEKGIIPCSWFCGVFLFLQVERGEKYEVSEFHCRILDPQEIALNSRRRELNMDDKTDEPGAAASWSTPRLSDDVLEGGWRTEPVPFNFEKSTNEKENKKFGKGRVGNPGENLVHGRTFRCSESESVQICFPGDKVLVGLEDEDMEDVMWREDDDEDDMFLENLNFPVRQEFEDRCEFFVRAESINAKAYADSRGIVLSTCNHLACQNFS